MLTALSVFLAGCSEFNEPIYEESEGFWNKYIVWPLVSLITTFKEFLVLTDLELLQLQSLFDLFTYH